MDPLTGLAIAGVVVAGFVGRALEQRANQQLARSREGRAAAYGLAVIAVDGGAGWQRVGDPDALRVLPRGDKWFIELQVEGLSQKITTLWASSTHQPGANVGGSILSADQAVIELGDHMAVGGAPAEAARALCSPAVVDAFRALLGRRAAARGPGGRRFAWLRSESHRLLLTVEPKNDGDIEADVRELLDTAAALGAALDASAQRLPLLEAALLQHTATGSEGSSVAVPTLGIR